MFFFAHPRALLTLGLLAALAACTDQPSPVETPVLVDDVDAVSLQALSCTADVRAASVACIDGEDDSLDAPPDGLSRIILNPAGKYVRFHITGAPERAGELFTFRAAVQNLLVQTLSVSESGLFDNHGVRVFFTRPPVATGGPGTITVIAETGNFTGDGQPFYRYPQTLATGETSMSQYWTFSVPTTVTTFTFSVLVAAKVQYPNGWIEIKHAPTVRVDRGASRTLGAVVRDVRGIDVTATSGPVTWSLQDTSVATLTGRTVTGAVISGQTTVWATSPGKGTGTAQIVVGDPFVQISGGHLHTCGLTSAGRVYCWGYNGQGQLGDGTTTDRDTPVPILMPVSTRFVQVSAGYHHTCARSSTGQAWCWGSNSGGALGDNSTTNRPNPVAVQQGATTFVDVSAGDAYTCARASTLKAWCWGFNGNGQLGDSTTTERHTPVAVHSIFGFTDITAGSNHTCALIYLNGTGCWGGNESGQLGDDTNTQRVTPTFVNVAHKVFTEVTAGASFTCGRYGSSEGKCWGNNSRGQIGYGNHSNQYHPLPVQGASPYAQISAGYAHACGRSLAGQTWCWGNNDSGQLGDNTTTERTTPVSVQQGTTRFAEIDAAGMHTCGRTATGQLYCWGDNSHGQLGDNTLVQRLTPVAVQKTP